MRLEFGLDERPPLPRTLLFGVQWAVVAASVGIILGKVAASAHSTQFDAQILYLQKIFFVTALSILLQVFLGHRLPVISGAAVVTLLGVTASRNSSPAAIYTAVMIGGSVITLLTISGLFEFVRRLFTPVVVAAILLLVAVTLGPTVLRLIIDSGSSVPILANLLFALAVMTMMFLLHRLLRGIWKSTLMIWTMALGSLLYFVLFPQSPSWAPVGSAEWVHGFFSELTLRPSFDPGVVLAFLVCYLALSINDVGAMQSMDPLLRPGNMARRLWRGMTVTGLGNVVAGFLGTLGIVNFSLSPGVIVSTACASRYVLIPAALIILLASFSPMVITLFASVPSVVIGCVLLYIATSQFAGGLVVILHEAEEIELGFDDGLVISLPVLLGTVIAFLPASVVAGLPLTLRPLLGNGFVVGVVAVLVLEHLVFRRRQSSMEAAQEA